MTVSRTSYDSALPGWHRWRDPSGNIRLRFKSGDAWYGSEVLDDDAQFLADNAVRVGWSYVGPGRHVERTQTEEDADNGRAIHAAGHASLFESPDYAAMGAKARELFAARSHVREWWWITNTGHYVRVPDDGSVPTLDLARQGWRFVGPASGGE